MIRSYKLREMKNKIEKMNVTWIFKITLKRRIREMERE